MSIQFRQRLLATTLFVGSSVLASPAWAQDEPEGPGVQTAESIPAEETASGDIVITGTLITNPNLVSSAPVNSVGEEEIELQQANVAEELLRELPGAVPSIGSAVNNGNGGASYVNLRGMGSNRNVVLIDGVRLVPSDLIGRFDLNNIPLALIQRVDVLTGGASTTYGADAIAGVVNFITRSDFSGIDINLSEQITELGDGNVFRGDVTMGANFDDGRGNAVLSIGYQEADPVYQGARTISVDNIDTFTGNAGGSGTAVPSRFTLPGLGTRQVNPATGAFNPTTAFTAFNFNPYNIFQTPFERFNIYGAANYEISDAIEVYTRGLFSKNTVNTIIAPSGAFGIAVQIPLSNPFLTPGLRNQFCAANGIAQADCDAAATAQPGTPAFREVTTGFFRRAVETGPRVSEFVTTFFDYRLGARGGITDSIEWDVFGAYGESDNIQTQQGYWLNSRVRQALRATNTTTCIDDSNGCVPLNPFGAPGSITPAMSDFLVGESTVATKVQLGQARATINGDFGVVSPFGTDPISFAVGGEYREYHASQVSDSLSQSGDLGGAGGAAPNIDGSFDVYEAFGELILPLVQDRPFFENLTLEAGIRYSKYHVRAPGDPSFNTTTWKVGGQWEPFDGLKFRGNYSHAVRAPNIAELFAPVNTFLTNLNDDPCAVFDDAGLRIRPNPTGTLRAICLAQGATAANVDTIAQPIAGQANATGGGNINLQPEDSDSWTIGAVFQPDFIPGLSLSIDYYHIKVTGAVTTPAPDDVITACFGEAGAGTPPTYSPPAGSEGTGACTAIRRDPLTGGLSGDPATTQGLPITFSNLGTLENSGIDFTANYSRDLGFAGLDLSFVLSWTEDSLFQAAPGSLNRECVGFYSANCASIQPEWQWSQRTTLTFGDIDVSLLWRHISGNRYEPNEGDPFTGTLPANTGGLAGRTVDFDRIKAYDYFDLTTRFAVSEEFTLTLSVQNLLDKAPPLVGSTAGSTAFNSGNTYPSTYDALGRRFVAAARLRF